MAELFECPTHTDHRGALTVLEKKLPFEVKRSYWMYDLNDEPRGGHRHKETIQAMVCLKGECEVVIKKNNESQTFTLKSPNQCLILEPEDWHQMRGMNADTVLLVFASKEYDPNDYVSEPL